MGEGDPRAIRASFTGSDLRATGDLVAHATCLYYPSVTNVRSLCRTPCKGSTLSSRSSRYPLDEMIARHPVHPDRLPQKGDRRRREPRAPHLLLALYL